MAHHKTSDHKNLPVDDGLHTAPRNWRLRTWGLAGLIFVIGSASRADDFEKISYDAAADELVIMVNYSGTNPDHQFTMNWGECQTKNNNQRELFGELIDQQARDAARQEFRKTVRISLAAVDCRPAMVTVRTAPRFLATVSIPASPSTR
jgi:hypothetical protein